MEGFQYIVKLFRGNRLVPENTMDYEKETRPYGMLRPDGRMLQHFTRKRMSWKFMAPAENVRYLNGGDNG